MNTRRQAFGLAGALTATVLTAVLAVAGMSHRPGSTATPAPTPVVQLAQAQAPAHWRDD